MNRVAGRRPPFDTRRRGQYLHSGVLPAAGCGRLPCRAGDVIVSSLFVIRGNDQGSRCQLEDHPVGVGRDSSNPFQLHDHEVSRQHAAITWDGSAHVLTDLESSNGTFVNGRRVHQHRLSSGDQVQMGGTLVLYTGPTEESAEEDLSHTVAIASPQQTGDRSQIVRAMPEAEGSRLFPFSAPAGARRGGGPRQFAGDLRRRAGHQPHAGHRSAPQPHHGPDLPVAAGRPGLRDAHESGGQTTGAQGPPHPAEGPGRRPHYHQQNDLGLRAGAQRRRPHQRRPAGRARWPTGASILQMGIREALCVPMQGRYGLVGVVYIDTSTSPQEVILQGGATKFQDEHLKLMIAIAHQAALAIEDTRYYSAMVQAERLAAMGQTIATLSHHIKNILQGIRGGSYLIEMGLSSHDESVLRKGWKIVEKNQHKISALVMDMLTFSKQREPDLMPADLNDMVADVVELAQAQAGEMKVELAWQPYAALPRLVFDPEGMHRAVLNLVTNAIDAAAEAERPGRVRVHTDYVPRDALVSIVVEDNGAGIAPDQLDKLFSPFISSKKGRGTGLGLPVSQKIVVEHGGKIVVASTPGQGSIFTVQIPAVSRRPTTRRCR